MIQISGMFLLNSRRLLCRHKSPNMQLLAISSTSTHNRKFKNVQERERCPQPIPPPPECIDLRPFIKALTLVVFTGSFVAYAKKNPELRDWLSIHTPWIDDFIAIVYQENMNYGQLTLKCIEQSTEYIKNLFCEDKEKAKIRQETETRGLDELKKCIEEVKERLVNSYKMSQAICEKYYQLVQESMSSITTHTLQELEGAKADRIVVIETALKNVADDTKLFEKLCGILISAVQESLQDVELCEELKRTKSMIDECKKSINVVKAAYLDADNKAVALNNMWTMVLGTLSKYTEQIQVLHPEIDYDSDKLQLTGDPDLLLYHTIRYVNQLENQFRVAETVLSQKIDRSMSVLSQEEKSVKEREKQITNRLKEEKSILDKEYKDRYAKLNEENEKKLKSTLETQLKQLQELIATKLEKKEIELNKEIERMIDEKVAEERQKMEPELASIRSRVEDIESKILAILKAEKAMKSSKDLYAAGEALIAATKRGCPVVKVDKELKAIKDAASEDKLVSTVLSSIPENIWTDGIVPESTLRKKYHSMEKVALKVALVEQEGASLPVYLMSWVQSLILGLKLPGIPQQEMNPKLTEPVTDMDTFDLLQRARFWMERNDLPRAMHYVRALQGASLAAAWWWYTAAKDHLEVRQAADALQAHATALSLSYV